MPASTISSQFSRSIIYFIILVAATEYFVISFVPTMRSLLVARSKSLGSQRLLSHHRNMLMRASTGKRFPTRSWRALVTATIWSIASGRTIPTATFMPITSIPPYALSSSKDGMRHASKASLVSNLCFLTQRLQSTFSPEGGEADPVAKVKPDIHDKKLSPRERLIAMAPPEDEEVLGRTLDWIQGVVIGFSLCPFADKPFRENKVHLEVIHESNQVEVLARVLAECFVRQYQSGTSLMICPNLFPTNFRAFLEVYNMVSEGMLVEHELTNEIQIAPFHPLFEFEGSGSDGIDNYTNRSPYPIFHILREEEVSTAVDCLEGDASKVWKRNVRLLEELDNSFDDDKLQSLFAGKPQSEQDKKLLKSILRSMNIQRNDT